MSRMERLVDVDATYTRSTDRAILIKSVQTGVEDWVPKGAVEYDSNAAENGVRIITVTMPEDLAIEKRFV